MAEYKLQVPRRRDRDLFEFLHSGATIVGTPNFSVTVTGAARGEQFQVSNETTDAAALARSDNYTIHNASFGISHFNLNISRSFSQDADFTFDVLSIASSGNTNEALASDKVAALNQLISETFLARADQSAGLFHNSKSFTLLMKSHQKMIEQMQVTIANVGEQAAAVRLRLEEEFDARRQKLAVEFDSKRADEERKIEEARQALEQRQADLDTFKKDLDDRSNTFARRDLHKGLKARLADRAKKFELTPETKGSRIPIHIGVVLASALVIVLIFYYSADLAPVIAAGNTAAMIAMAIKPALLTVAFLGLLTWYLRWMNRWFERYADAEFHLKQFELDIDRASWVVETALEWKEVQDKPMPDQLLENISRNLFSRSEKDEAADMHPADYLASAILGRASGLNLKLPGAEIAYSGRDLKKLQKDDAG
ncbi:MAG: hypothetical protein EOS11_00125 [Mesorhizobium sp.]|uniref:hypothetical protein n=1 Tax=Mesorhizobium sp. TaxID=1871066 RepID=UPI000FE3D5A0|nr:hypothetical protein [Mesorhizobium sp.]RWO50604.1 MAG: hypothetical protein EOS11_00125 [Mesorhizobium sp.]TIN75782.1 MAG: hypothetical protein E5Y09_26135 [Mesorhizobium sp.]